MTYRQKTTHTIEIEDRPEVIRAETGPLPEDDATELAETTVYTLGSYGRNDSVLWRRFVRIAIGGEHLYVVRLWYRYERLDVGNWAFSGIADEPQVRVFDPESWDWSDRGIDAKVAIGIVLALHDPIWDGMNEALERLRERELSSVVGRLEDELRRHRQHLGDITD